MTGLILNLMIFAAQTVFVAEITFTDNTYHSIKTGENTIPIERYANNRRAAYYTLEPAPQYEILDFQPEINEDIALAVYKIEYETEFDLMAGETVWICFPLQNSISTFSNNSVDVIIYEAWNNTRMMPFRGIFQDFDMETDPDFGNIYLRVEARENCHFRVE